MEEKIRRFEAFWAGEGPSLLLIPPTTQAMYDLDDYPRRFHSPEIMWESEMRRARPALDWPTDGIPTVRPNLGVVFVPTMFGQSCKVQPEQMPWPGKPLSREQIRAGRDVAVYQTELMRLAEEFYDIHAERGRDEGIYAYHADTQGVFDVAHLVYGDSIFYDLADPEERDWMDELMAAAGDVYVRASQYVKGLIGERTESMIHGHGTCVGAYFPTAGVRMSEDTPTLLSPETIERVVLPAIEKAAGPFGGGVFIHYCGLHKRFFEQLCHMECVRAIDLGNPEMYDTRWLMERCAETGTVLHSRLAALDGEDWRDYADRLGRMVRETGVRCILRPVAYPADRDCCEEMLDRWHAITA